MKRKPLARLLITCLSAEYTKNINLSVRTTIHAVVLQIKKKYVKKRKKGCQWNRQQILLFSFLLFFLNGLLLIFSIIGKISTGICLIWQEIRSFDENVKESIGSAVSRAWLCDAWHLVILKTVLSLYVFKNVSRLENKGSYIGPSTTKQFTRSPNKRY